MDLNKPFLLRMNCVILIATQSSDRTKEIRRNQNYCNKGLKFRKIIIKIGAKSNHSYTARAFLQLLLTAKKSIQRESETEGHR